MFTLSEAPPVPLKNDARAIPGTSPINLVPRASISCSPIKWIYSESITWKMNKLCPTLKSMFQNIFFQINSPVYGPKINSDACVARNDTIKEKVMK